MAESNGTRSLAEKIIAGLLVTVSMGALTNGLLLWRDVSLLQERLDNWQMNTWALEKQLLLIEHAQFEARISVNESNIEELENEVREIR